MDAFTESSQQSLPSSHLSGRSFKLCSGEAVPFHKLDNYPHSHIIGELRHILDEGEKVTALAVYEVSLPVIDPPVALPPVRVEIIGDARRIKCTCCIHRSRWEIGKAAIKVLVRKNRNAL